MKRGWGWGYAKTIQPRVVDFSFMTFALKVCLKNLFNQNGDRCRKGIIEAKLYNFFFNLNYLTRFKLNLVYYNSDHSLNASICSYLTFLNTKKYNVVCPKYIYDVTVVIKMNMSRGNLFLHQPIETPSMLLRSILIYSFPCSI